MNAINEKTVYIEKTMYRLNQKQAKPLCFYNKNLA